VPASLRAPRPGRSAHQKSHAAMCALLQQVLKDAVQSGTDTAAGIDSVACRATAGLYALLINHLIDRRGRCQLCRSRGWWGRRRVCLVFRKAHYWLRQHPGHLPAHLASEWEIDLLPPPADRQITQVLSGITADPSGDPSRTPAVPLPLPARPFLDAGRLDPDHGGAGVHLPDGPWPRRGPVDNPLPGPDPAVLLTGSVLWPG
jgi:hypothetical protein